MSSASIRPFRVPFRPTALSCRSVWKVVEITERFVAAGLLGLTLPLLVGAVIAIVVLSRRTPLVAHRRVTRGGKTLWVLKLRTMWGQTAGVPEAHRFGLVERLPPSSPEVNESKSVHDPRVTSGFAAFCRRYSVDELPQLWQVVRGQMALVGPRPLTQAEIDRYYGTTSEELLSRRPGLSGLWQIRGRSRLTYNQRQRLDLFLVRRWSFRLYTKVLFATVPKVLSGADAW